VFLYVFYVQAYCLHIDLKQNSPLTCDLFNLYSIVVTICSKCFNTKALCMCPQNIFMHFITAIISPNGTNQLVFVIKIQCVFLRVGNWINKNNLISDFKALTDIHVIARCLNIYFSAQAIFVYFTHISPPPKKPCKNISAILGVFINISAVSLWL
jgi:hypothetical protein